MGVAAGRCGGGGRRGLAGGRGGMQCMCSPSKTQHVLRPSVTSAQAAGSCVGRGVERPKVVADGYILAGFL